MKIIKAYLVILVCFGLLACDANTGKSDFEIYISNYDWNQNALSATSRADKGGSGVMLQAYNWNSCKLGKSWWKTVKSNSSMIKDKFEYVWFPPVSDSGSDNGYLPRQLNDLNSAYGSASDLIAAINSVKSEYTKPIADIVINHRVGTTSWGDFTNPTWGNVKKVSYYTICNNDEGFSNSNADMYGCSARGGADTGASYGSGRDLDHTNVTVQNGIVDWLKNYIIASGFEGYRYDFVKGFSGNYVGMYNNRTDAAFSVGEYWPTDNFSCQSPSSWSTQIRDWIISTSMNGKNINHSRAFDFVLKGMMNTVFGSKNGTSNGNYNLLASNYNLYKAYPGYAVTFVDNHDTGSTQSLWPLDSEDIAAAYVFILTHPGIPCVAWQHYFTASQSGDSGSQYSGGNSVNSQGETLQSLIDKLISLRKNAEISDLSSVELMNVAGNLYRAKVLGKNSTVIVNLGRVLAAPAGYSLYVSGDDFAVFVEDIPSEI